MASLVFQKLLVFKGILCTVTFHISLLFGPSNIPRDCDILPRLLLFEFLKCSILKTCILWKYTPNHSQTFLPRTFKSRLRKIQFNGVARVFGDADHGAILPEKKRHRKMLNIQANPWEKNLSLGILYFFSTNKFVSNVGF